MVGVMLWHIFRVRRDGGIASPPSGSENKIKRISRFDLVRKEVQVMLIAGAVVLMLSVLIPAPIDQPLTENGALTGDSQAPWFFLWIQQLLQLGSPFLWGVIVPILIILVLGLLPYWLPTTREEDLGRWFPAGSRIAQVLASLIIGFVLVLTFLGFIN
jgi:hypothetical protein